MRLIGHCELPDDVPGEWREATCAEFKEAIRAAGGWGVLTVWSSLTDMTGCFGDPFLFTCWGTDDRPVAAHGGHPDNRRPCAHQHAVFFAAPTPPGASDAAGVAADVDEASAPPAAPSAEAGVPPGGASGAGLGGFDNH